MSGNGTTSNSEEWKVGDEGMSGGDRIPVQLQHKDYTPLMCEPLEKANDGTPQWWREKRGESEKTNRPPKFIFAILDPRDDQKKFVAFLDPPIPRSHRIRMVVQYLKWEMQYEKFEE